MSTRRGADWACDHGAQYFTARDPAFGVEVERWQREGVAALWQPRLKVFEGAAGHATDRQLERFVGLPRMTAPARLLAEGLSLQTALTAVALHRESAAWQVETAETGRIDALFDGVILAVPAVQALPLLAPVSPVLAAEARAGHMAACWAMMLRFDTVLDLSFDAAFVNRGPLRWVARDSSKPGRDGQECWSLHASAEWSEAHLEEDAEIVAPILIEAFKALGGALPQAWSAHRWRYAITDSAVDGGCVWHAADDAGHGRDAGQGGVLGDGEERDVFLALLGGGLRGLPGRPGGGRGADLDALGLGGAHEAGHGHARGATAAARGFRRHRVAHGRHQAVAHLARGALERRVQFVGDLARPGSAGRCRSGPGRDHRVRWKAA